MLIRMIGTMMKRAAGLTTRAYAAYLSFRTTERGASMVEYALIVALIALVAFVAVAIAGQALDSRYDSIADSVQRAGPGFTP